MRAFACLTIAWCVGLAFACGDSSGDADPKDGGGGATSGDAWSGSDGGGGPPAHAAGTVASTSLSLPGSLKTACEPKWTIRLLAYHPDAKVPRRMYFGSCTPAGGKTKLLVSASVKDGVTATSVSGAVAEAEVDATGTLVPTGLVRQFPECHEMHGIAAKSDCSMVAVLCRRATHASETGKPTKDMVAALPDTGSGGERWWLTQPGSPDAGQENDEEWIYEWPDGDVKKDPATYVAHKAIGGWVYGSQYLLYGQKDDTFGLSLKATVAGGGTWHEGDAFLVVNRADHTIDTKRGWKWGCAPGHTIFNHPAFNPATSKYAVTCGTDLGTDPKNAGGFGGIWMHEETGKQNGYLSVPLFKSLSFGGGPTSLQPLPDGGFLGVFAGINGPVSPNQDFQQNGPVTSIGLIRFDASGTPVGPVKLVASMPGVFLSYPQLAPLGDGTYLLGYAEMDSLTGRQSPKKNDDKLRVPGAYHVLEIDQDGNPLTSAQTLNGAGWGEQDQMVPLGNGRVGWAYSPTPVFEGTTTPPCESNQLALHVYTRK